MNTNLITQQYLEGLRKNHKNVNKLVEDVLERTVQFAKEDSWASSTYIHKDEYDAETMRKAYKKLRERKFLVALKEYDSDNMDGYLGEIRIYLDSESLLKGNKLTEDNFDSFLDKLSELA